MNQYTVIDYVIQLLENSKYYSEYEAMCALDIAIEYITEQTK